MGKKKEKPKEPNFRRKPVTRKDLLDFPEKLTQLEGRDVIVHAGTGSGKTAIAGAALLHEKSKGMTIIFVSPLISLQNEQAETFQRDFKLKAVAVNSSHGGCRPEVIKGIVKGDYQVVIISPEMLLSKRFVDEVLRKPEFTRRVLALVVDEAHVISHWGSGFQKKYGELGMVRAFLPKHTFVVALSATLPRRVRRDVMKKLHIDHDSVKIDIGNDRVNVSLVVRPIHNPINSFIDLDFVIPKDATNVDEIPKTFIYYDNVMGAIDMEDHIIDILPDNLKTEGVVRLFSAGYSDDYREKMQLECGSFLDQSLLLYNEQVERLETLAARHGLGVLLVEKTAYSVDLEKEVNDRQGAKAKKQVTSSKEQAAVRKVKDQYAKSCGVLRGTYTGKSDTNVERRERKLDGELEHEGLYTLVQTGICRRRVLAMVFDQDADNLGPTVPCCDLCNVELLNRVRPGPPLPKSKRKSAIKKSDQPFMEIQTKLREWRSKTHQEDFRNSMFGPSAILPDDLIQDLASVGPIPTLIHLDKILAGRWYFFSEYGSELLTVLKEIVIPEAKVSSKRARADSEATENKAANPTRNPTKKARQEVPEGVQEGITASSQQTSVPVQAYRSDLFSQPTPDSTQFIRPDVQFHSVPIWTNGPHGLGWYQVVAPAPAGPSSTQPNGYPNQTTSYGYYTDPYYYTTQQ
ncbi:hypothetical protein K435DRAFT_866442 [Dendrothele bispora CBS 962.96]|uniref:DNA 3'-5' helicase n=2 Tax=Dendrothele bispora (strain CBS 962.96) TaxID=1314807 RepID=A0A4S8LHJ1_DENBC|nr:hypothetical protein K435DRAFT_866442 [Dendrothele bispora CBS 962.96]